MTKEEAKKFGLHLLQGIMERNESYPEYANNVKQAVDALSEESDSSEIPKDLEEAANVYSNCYSNPDGALARAARRAYITGAKWDREQMMSKAIEATLDNTAYPTRLWFNTYLSEYSNGDKVRVIIVKED